MADKDGIKQAKDYALDTPFVSCRSFYVKGMDHVEWGMKKRLAKIFRPDSGKTVMLAFDHGYIMGSTQGLERLDLVVPPLTEHVDALMAHVVLYVRA